MGNVRLMAVGNVLMGDDALGPHVLRLLEAAYDFSGRVSLLDAGTPGLDLALWVEDLEALVVVDAIRASGPPGEVHEYRDAELTRGALPIVTGPHQPALCEALLRCELVGRAPRRAYLVGAIPERVATGAGLSAAVRAAIPEIEWRIVRELRELGTEPARRAVPSKPDLWWEPRGGEGSAP